MIATKVKPMEITATISGEELTALFSLLGRTSEKDRVDLGLTKEHALLLRGVFRELYKSGCRIRTVLHTPPSHIGDAFSVPLRDS